METKPPVELRRLSGARYQIFTHPKGLQHALQIFDSNGDCKEASKAKRTYDNELLALRPYYVNEPTFYHLPSGRDYTITVALFSE